MTPLSHRWAAPPEVSIGMLRLVRRAMREAGVAETAIRAALAHHHVDLDRRDRSVPWVVYRDVWLAAEASTDDEAIGLRVAESVPSGARDAIDFAMRTADSGGAVAELAMRLAPIVNGGAIPSIVLHPRGICVSSRLRDGLTGTSAMSDYTLARILDLVRLVLDSDVTPLEGMLARQSPRCVSRHRDFFRFEVTFDAAFNGIVLPRELLSRRLPHADERLHRVLLSHPRLTAIQRDDSSLEERIVRAASEMLESGRQPAQITVARRLGLSARTLRRMLEAEGTSFASVIDDVRCTRARRQLLEGHRLADVAESLGYESTSTFVRAFRRWTGETPAAWRARRGDDADHTDGASTSDVRAPPRSTPT